VSSRPWSAWFAQRHSELSRIPVLARRVLPAIRSAKVSRTAPFIAWLESHAARTPDALFCEQGDERVSFAEAKSRARRRARVLVDAGVQRGDVVALVGGSSPGYLELILAVSYAGAAAALINWRAFLAYSVGMALLFAFVLMLALAGAMLFGGTRALQANSTAFAVLWTLLPVWFASSYLSYRDVFDVDSDTSATGEEPPKSPTIQP